MSSDKPVIYWITDKNPARIEQVETFHRWLVEQGHVDENGEAVCELRLDTSNSDMTKKVIQSVSGVGSDVMDLYNGPAMRLMSSMSVLAPVEEPAARLGFSLADTYAVLEPELWVDGHQYMYPCNVTARTVLVNPAAFEAAGQPQPPRRWSVDEFERAGLAFIEAANPPGTPPADRKFFLDQVPIDILWRSFGASQLNETGTASGFDAPGHAEALRLSKKWVYEDRIVPTPDDVAAFATAQGYGGASLQLFGRGNYAMVSGGRYFLIQFRNFPNLRNLTVVEVPNGGFPNTTVGTRAAAVYAGSENQEYAHLFLAYLASDAYNDLIVRDADALPPNPAALKTEAFLRPPAHPDEWNFHGPSAEMATTIGIGGSYSPFIQTTELLRERESFEQLYLIGRISLEEAVARTHGAVNRRIRGTVARKPDLKPEYDRRVILQAGGGRAAGQRRADPGELDLQRLLQDLLRADRPPGLRRALPRRRRAGRRQRPPGRPAPGHGSAPTPAGRRPPPSRPARRPELPHGRHPLQARSTAARRRHSHRRRLANRRWHSDRRRLADQLHAARARRRPGLPRAQHPRRAGLRDLPGGVQPRHGVHQLGPHPAEHVQAGRRGRVHRAGQPHRDGHREPRGCRVGRRRRGGLRRRPWAASRFLTYFGNTLFFMMGIPLAVGGSLIAAIMLSQDTRGGGGRNYAWLIAGGLLLSSCTFLAILGAGASAMTLLVVGAGCGILLMGLAGGLTFYRTVFYTPTLRRRAWRRSCSGRTCTPSRPDRST